MDVFTFLIRINQYACQSSYKPIFGSMLLNCMDKIMILIFGAVRQKDQKKVIYFPLVIYDLF